MPIITISDGQGNLLPMALIEVLSRMHFPNGGEEQAQFTAWSLIGALAKLPEDACTNPFPREYFQTIIRAPSYETVTTQMKRVRQQSGSTAGSVLWFVLSCKHNHPQYKPSLNKAWDVLSIAWSESKSKKASSVSYIKKSWADFKSVAHLWAAWDVFSSIEVKEGEGNGEGLTYAHLLTNKEEGNLFLTFLSMANSFGHQMAEIIPQGQKSPLVSLSDLWLPPADLLEKSPSRGVEVIPCALPAEQVEILKARRAHSRYIPSMRR